MTGIPAYSTTASENVNSNTGINWDEGMPPATVNNSARQNMADMRSQWNDASWFQYGNGSKTVAHTYASATSTTIATDQTTYYHAGRRVKAVGSGTGTIYGSIASSSYSAPNTTINYTWDSGSLSNETLTIYAGTVQVTGQPVPSTAIGGITKTWTPIDSSGAGLSLTVTGAGYLQIGNMVHVWASITFPVTASANQIIIGGLPATVKNSNGVGGGFSILGLSTDNGQFIKNTTTFQVNTVSGGSRANSAYSAGAFYFQAWYPTA